MFGVISSLLRNYIIIQGTAVRLHNLRSSFYCDQQCCFKFIQLRKHRMTFVSAAVPVVLRMGPVKKVCSYTSSVDLDLLVVLVVELQLLNF